MQFFAWRMAFMTTKTYEHRPNRFTGVQFESVANNKSDFMLRLILLAARNSDFTLRIRIWMIQWNWASGRLNNVQLINRLTRWSEHFVLLHSQISVKFRPQILNSQNIYHKITHTIRTQTRSFSLSKCPLFLCEALGSETSSWNELNRLRSKLVLHPMATNWIVFREFGCQHLSMQRWFSHGSRLLRHRHLPKHRRVLIFLAIECEHANAFLARIYIIPWNVLHFR